MPYSLLLSTVLVTKFGTKGFILHSWLSWAELVVCLGSLAGFFVMISNVVMRSERKSFLALASWMKHWTNLTIATAAKLGTSKLRSHHSSPKPESTSQTIRRDRGLAPIFGHFSLCA